MNAQSSLANKDETDVKDTILFVHCLVLFISVDDVDNFVEFTNAFNVVIAVGDEDELQYDFINVHAVDVTS